MHFVFIFLLFFSGSIWAADTLVYKEVEPLLGKNNRQANKNYYKPADSTLKELQRIKTIRLLLQHPEGICDTLHQDNSVVKTGTLHMRRNHEVYGYQPYWTETNGLNHNYRLFSTLAFYGYELDEKTGGYRTLNGWDTVSVINVAKQLGCEIELCVYNKTINGLKGFLNRPAAQKRLADVVCRLLEKRKANGVNIFFEGMEQLDEPPFAEFIWAFSKYLKKANKDYKLTITVPVLDSLNYDIEQLEPYVDRFVINFSRKQLYGPIAPLNGGDYSLSAGVARMLATKVNPVKMVACLPYYGALWDVKTGDFVQYIKYNRIVRNYANTCPTWYYENDAYIAIKNKSDIQKELWYDDARTISVKYDFLLSNNIGIGIWALGYDDGQPELWDVLMNKVAVIDTSDVKQIKNRTSFWHKIKMEFALYKTLFQHPCKFGNKERERMISDNFIDDITLVMILLLLSASVYSVTQSRILGDDWRHRKLFLRILIALVVLVMISVLLFCFLRPEFKHFGINDNGDCETSFGTILEVLGIGFLIGLLAMKFLVFPLVKPKDIP